MTFKSYDKNPLVLIWSLLAGLLLALATFPAQCVLSRVTTHECFGSRRNGGRLADFAGDDLWKRKNVEYDDTGTLRLRICVYPPGYLFPPSYRKITGLGWHGIATVGA
eukprot:scaffold282263_cov39-Prasinocladus_malaysianus.AAC.1